MPGFRRDPTTAGNLSFPLRWRLGLVGLGSGSFQFLGHPAMVGMSTFVEKCSTWNVGGR
jgi:hypothetical protein